MKGVFSNTSMSPYVRSMRTCWETVVRARGINLHKSLKGVVPCCNRCSRMMIRAGWAKARDQKDCWNDTSGNWGALEKAMIECY